MFRIIKKVLIRETLVLIIAGASLAFVSFLSSGIMEIISLLIIIAYAVYLIARIIIWIRGTRRSVQTKSL